ncbi:MAG: hypothetical protein AAFY88_13080 [Acidobacteriota bacterium]
MSHLLWLIGVGTAAILLLRPSPPASPTLRRLAVTALVAMVADGVAWPLGVEWLRPLTALLGGVLFIVAAREIGRTATTTTDPGSVDGGPGDEPTPKDDVPHRLALALERWPQPAALATGDGALEWANAAWKSEHGVAEIAGTTWADYQAPSEAARWQLLLEGARDRRAAEGFLQHRGTPESWASRSQATTVEDGGEPRVLITAVRQSDAEAELRRQTREVGHNLNNVLSAVVGNVGLAIETPGIDGDLQADLREAETGALRAAELIHQLQALARGES